MSRVCFHIQKISKQFNHFLVFHVTALVILKDCFKSVGVGVGGGGGGSGGFTLCVCVCHCVT